MSQELVWGSSTETGDRELQVTLFEHIFPYSPSNFGNVFTKTKAI